MSQPDPALLALLSERGISSVEDLAILLSPTEGPTKSREFILWLVDKIDDEGDDIRIEWPDDPNSEVVGVWKGEEYYNVHVSHTNTITPLPIQTPV